MEIYKIGYRTVTIKDRKNEHSLVFVNDKNNRLYDYIGNGIYKPLRKGRILHYADTTTIYKGKGNLQ